MDRRILLGAAFIFCAAGVYGLLTNTGKVVEPVAEPLPEVTMTEVWIVKQPVKRGEKMNPVRLQAQRVAPEVAQKAGVLSEKRFAIQEGAVAGMDFAAGAIIAENQLLSPGQPEYLELLLGPDKVPYPISFESNDAMITMISAGDYVDVMLIASVDQNLAARKTLNSFEGLSVTPLLKKRRVLEIKEADSGNSTVVISLEKKDISRMMIARRIGLLDVYKSGQSPLSEAHVSDVLKDYTSVTELRGDQLRGAERAAF
ncbi:Flp pilus assembly protein CpaB [Endozoicomonas sp.]|uniref:Flp pilus assembly protein CpaB n=1 Tax=Endozoicomonas sp. TaxID=1892382 RepID=UPI0028866049|nr:Flp pilus assembly protein CpaB [Endozoicomonas sp.]